MCSVRLPQLSRWLRWWSFSVMRPRRLPADLGKVAAVALCQETVSTKYSVFSTGGANINLLNALTCLSQRCLRDAEGLDLHIASSLHQVVLRKRRERRTKGQRREGGKLRWGRWAHDVKTKWGLSRPWGSLQSVCTAWRWRGGGGKNT